MAGSITIKCPICGKPALCPSCSTQNKWSALEFKNEYNHINGF